MPCLYIHLLYLLILSSASKAVGTGLAEGDGEQKQHIPVAEISRSAHLGHGPCPWVGC